MSSPEFLRYTRSALVEAGLTVSIQPLAGHGTSPEDLEKTTRFDWINSADTALQELKGKCAKVFVLGHSMGCTLAFQLAKHRDLAGLVLLAPSVEIKSPLARSTGVLKHVVRSFPSVAMDVQETEAYKDPSLLPYRRTPPVPYTKIFA